MGMGRHLGIAVGLAVVVLLVGCGQDQRLLPMSSDGQGDAWGFIGPDGRYAIGPRFYDVEAFHDGTAVVYIGTSYSYGGVIDREGNYTILPQWNQYLHFVRGIARLGEADRPIYIDRQGNRYASDSLPVHAAGYWKTLYRGYCEVEDEDNALFDAAGIAMDESVDEVMRYPGGFSWTKGLSSTDHGEWIVLDETPWSPGPWPPWPAIEEVVIVGDTYAVTKRLVDGKMRWGVTSVDGRELVEHKYSVLHPLLTLEQTKYLAYGLSQKTEDPFSGPYGIVSISGKVCSPPKFLSVLIYDDKAMVKTLDGRRAIYDIEKQTLVSVPLEEGPSMQRVPGLFLVRTEGQWKYLSADDYSVVRTYQPGPNLVASRGVLEKRISINGDWETPAEAMAAIEKLAGVTIAVDWSQFLKAESCDPRKKFDLENVTLYDAISIALGMHLPLGPNPTKVTAQGNHVTISPSPYWQQWLDRKHVRLPSVNKVVRAINECD